MSTVSRLMLTVCVAVFFSSNVFAKVAYFLINNNTHMDMDFHPTGNKYCVYSAAPEYGDILPGNWQEFAVNYSRLWIDSLCYLEHSSQEFLGSIQPEIGTLHHFTVTWYKPYRKDPEIRISKLPKIPGHEHFKVKISSGSFVGTHGPIVTFSE